MRTTEGTSGPRFPYLVPAAVLGVLCLVALAIFAATRGLVRVQNNRLLDERSDEVASLLTTTIQSVQGSLAILAELAASTDPGAADLFATSAGPLAHGPITGVGLAAAQGDGFVAAATVGDGPPVGDPIAPDRAAVLARARAEGRLVTELLPVPGRASLMIALPVRTESSVVYLESVLDPSQVRAPTSDSPFRQLNLSLYAAPEPDPSRLVFGTEPGGAFPEGRVERVPLQVGADTWLLAVGAREPLVGALSRWMPWLFLAGGVVTAFLAAAMAEVLARRRTYALALVARRTAELEEALDDLRRSEAFVDRLLRALPVLVARISLRDHRLTYASPNVERLFGLAQEAALAPGFLADHLHPEDLPAVEAALRRVVTDGVTVGVECRFRHGDGSYSWLAVVVVPESDGDEGQEGKVTGIFGYALDVDDRHRAQEAQQEAQAAAEAANRAKSEFLSRMSHELRTPLNAVLGFGQLLEMEELSGEQRESVDQILKGGRHLLDLINEVLDISRIESGQLTLSPEPLSGAALIQDSVDLIRPLAAQREIRLLVTHAHVEDCYVFADHQRARQVLLNLLSNAVKYNRSRGTVAVSCELHHDTRIRIGVTDTGYGIPAERMRLLFVPFERLGAEETDVEGTGIGLALSQRLAEAMDGTVEVTSTPGRGSTFTLDLPRVEGPVERYERLTGTSAPAPLPSAHRHRVLHIEDNLSNLKLVERILERRGDVELIAAMQGGLGIELAREHRPGLVLLDLHLPDIGGEQVLQRLRQDPATASIPVVIVSADATTRQVQRLLSAGATGYLTKPIAVPELLRVLEEALRPAVPAS